MTDSSPVQESTELNAQIENVINHYQSLVEHGRKSVYPLVKTDLLGMRPPSFDIWPRWRKNVYQLSTPFAFLENGINGYSMTSAGIWLLSFGVWIVLFSACLQIYFGKSIPSTQSSALRWFDYLTLAIYILSIILIPLAYGRTLYFLLNKNTTWKTRTIFLISTVAFLLIMLSATQTDYPGIYGKIQNVAYQRNAFLWIFFLFLVPASFFGVYIILVGGRVGIWLINYLLESFVTSYNPYRYKSIRKIINESIFTDEGTWKLVDLSVHEIQSIREWARDNR